MKVACCTHFRSPSDDQSLLCFYVGLGTLVVCLIVIGGRRGGSVVGGSDLAPEGREFEPWPVYPHCVLRQNTVPLPTQVYKWESANCLAVFPVY